jgi:acyl carrier protein
LAFAPDFSIASAKLLSNEELSVTATFDKVADIIAETSEIDRDSITPESHTIDDLGIDSLDFLDIVFAVDKEFGIKIPLEQWTQEVNDGKASTEEYFRAWQPLHQDRRAEGCQGLRPGAAGLSRCSLNISR